jgi:hypothetical protein
MRERHDTSTLRTPGRIVSIVTTAALPWRTGAGTSHAHRDRTGMEYVRTRPTIHAGTSINPMLRAAHLAEDPDRKVTPPST